MGTAVSRVYYGQGRLISLLLNIIIEVFIWLCVDEGMGIGCVLGRYCLYVGDDVGAG